MVNGTVATESGCTINTTAASTPGTNANLSGTINLSDSTISTTAAASYGAYANSGTINLDDVSITTGSANALFLNSGTINYTLGSVITNGASTNGAQLLGTGSSLVLNDVSIQSNGTASVGLFVQLGNNSVNATNCTITTTANGARGVDVGLGSGAASSATLNNCTLNVAQGSGPPSFGAVVARNGSSVALQDSFINTEVYGVHTIGSGASITADNTQINVTANAAVFGAYAQNNTTITLQNNTQVVTSGGNNAHGFVIQDGSTGNLFNSGVQTSGTNAQGVFMIGFTAGNLANISNATVSTAGVGASAISSFANVGVTNTLQAANTAFSAVNEDLISIAGGTADFTFNSVTAKAAAGHNLLLVDGSNPATINWTANTSTLGGDMLVIPGNTSNVVLNNSTWRGAALDVTNLTTNSATWNLSANSTITNQLLNNGLIDFISEGDIFKTLTVSGPYIGQGGTIGLNTFLGGDGSPSDLLIVEGTATGSTFLNITNTSGPGELTNANGILVVNAINGGTTDPGAFSLANYVVAGPYEYNLFRGDIDNATPDNWYLRSSQIPVPPTPDYRREVSLYSALPSMTLLYSRALLDTLHQRVGDEELLHRNTCLSSDPYFNGFWVRGINQGGYQHNGGIFKHGPNFNYQFWAVQAGIDVLRYEYEDGSRDFAGILGAAGNGSGKVKHYNGVYAGKDKFKAYTGGVYWTHFNPCGLYVDGVVETTWYRNMRTNSTRGLTLKTHGTDIAASLESGYPMEFMSLNVEPQVQLIYQNIHLHNGEDAGAYVNFKNTSSTAGRVGLRIDDTWSIDPLLFTTWIRGNIWHDFQGKSRTAFASEEGPITFASDLGGSWFQGDIGLTSPVTETITFYGSFGGNVYLNGHGQAYTAIAGLRANF